MTDDEILAEFVRVEGSKLMAASISWPDPGTPEMKWEIVGELPDGLPQQEVDAAKAKVLTDSRYFDRCSRCGELKPLGWMHEPGFCQGCAEQQLGIVH